VLYHRGVFSCHCPAASDQLPPALMHPGSCSVSHDQPTLPHPLPATNATQEARVAAYRGKMHWKKSGPGIAVARGEFGELTRGELTRFYCTYLVTTSILVLSNGHWPGQWATSLFDLT